MKKFMHNVRATFGDVEKTKDAAADQLGAQLAAAQTALRDHMSAISAMKRTAADLVSAMECAAKAFMAMALLNQSPALEALARAISHTATDCRATAAAQYAAALDRDAPGVRRLQAAVEESRRLEEARARKARSYDVARYTVRTKEEAYQRKGKSIEQSATYPTEVAECQRALQELEDADRVFKKTAAATLQDMDETYLAAMKEYVMATQALFANFQTTLAAIQL
ncbi:hypothetical protein STCU_10220 [Strigomonas culicis]|uniref:BAR domain-containing protein n=1 Tax=Strigomonas culicis TaxID=28005 RepID=S9V5B5_9TRYP|nr:hypothetical protein STCU_10220 [Strigomonas culicis]|eukprot:EPY18065.1 hypothetical protein STCU_10220 [Strigomonas culicis]